MKKILIGAVIVAASTAAYIFQQQQISTSYNVLDYVPADTPIFAGQLEPFPLKDYLLSAPTRSNLAEKDVFSHLNKNNDPKLKFLLNIFKTYQNKLQTPDQLLTTFGLADQTRTYFYTLGMLPVFKIEIANPKAIWDLLDKNEHESGVTHRKGTLQTLNYRAYSVTDNASKLEVIVAIDKGILTITLNSAFNDQRLLATALGLTKAKNSLAASGKIEKLIKTHQFKKDSIAFINHIELIKGLTTSDANLLAQQITENEKLFKTESPFSSIRTPQCAADLASISNNWPSTVMGYTNLMINSKESTADVAMIIESKNQEILNALQSLRGYIPEYTTDIDNSVLAIGLGIDINQLSGTVTDIWQDLQTPVYTCQPLAQLQSQIKQSGSSLAMLGMGANIANGIKGTSVGILDFTLSQIDGEPKLDHLDALLTVSADDPKQIFNSLKMFLPGLQNIELNNDGKEIDLNSLIPIAERFNLAPKLAIKGKHILIYNGEKSKKIADNLASEPLIKNGIYSMAFDFKKLFTPIASAIELSGEKLPKDALFLSNYNAQIKANIDINPHGIIFSSHIKSQAPHK